jgi:hypothetical protein
MHHRAAALHEMPIKALGLDCPCITSGRFRLRSSIGHIPTVQMETRQLTPAQNRLQKRFWEWQSRWLDEFVHTNHASAPAHDFVRWVA